LSKSAWTAFAIVSLLWGIPYFLIKVALDDGMPPAFLAWVRIVLGAIVLLALAHRAGVLDSVRGRWRWLAVFGVIEIAIPFPLIAAGEQYISSSLAAILIAAAPLFVALLALRFDANERASGRRLVGLVTGFAGVVALMGIDVAGEPDELIGAGAILAAAFCYAVGPMILKRHLSDLDPRASMGAALALAAVFLAPAAALDPPDAVPSAGATISVISLGLLCTALALVFFGRLITLVGPGRATVVTYVNPLVAVTLGAVLLDERLGLGALIGLLLILGGSWLSTTARTRRQALDASESEAPATSSVRN
jgi:drug/metabolite transporter (DMT)-like permease